MEKKNPIFKKNYESYLQQLDGVDLSMCGSILGVAVHEEKGIAKVQFFMSEGLHRFWMRSVGS